MGLPIVSGCLGLGAACTNSGYGFDVQLPTGVGHIGATTGTNNAYLHFTNTGGDYWLGINRSDGGGLVTGGTVYGFSMKSAANRNIEIAPGGTVTTSFVPGGGMSTLPGGTVPAVATYAAVKLAYNGTTCTHTSVKTAAFTGSGLDDAASGGTSTTVNPAVFIVQIDGNGVPDTFKWNKDGGSYTATVPITAGAIALSDGVTVTFAATIGHLIGDLWTIKTGAGCWSVNSGTAVAAVAATTHALPFLAAPAKAWESGNIALDSGSSGCTGTSTAVISDIGTANGSTYFKTGLTHNLKSASAYTNVAPAAQGSDLATAQNWTFTLTTTGDDTDVLNTGCTAKITLPWMVRP